MRLRSRVGIVVMMRRDVWRRMRRVYLDREGCEPALDDARGLRSVKLFTARFHADSYLSLN